MQESLNFKHNFSVPLHTTQGPPPIPPGGIESTRDAPARGKSSFALAFRVLPPDERRALDALYGFCRAVDDAVDDAASPEEARLLLSRWRQALDGVFAKESGDDAALPSDGISRDLRGAVQRFPIRRADLEAVIEGCEWDASVTRYATWSELRDYCKRVASAVGLASIEIFGYKNPRTRDYAVNLGIALQLTNILRDVDEDAARGRIYLPAEDLATFGVTESDLVLPSSGGRRPAAVERLLRFEAARARLHYARARAALPAADRPRMVAAEIMADVYFALLEELERHHFPRVRVALPRATKAWLALRRVAISRVRGIRHFDG